MNGEKTRYCLPLIMIALCLPGCATPQELTLAHDVNVPKEFRSGSSSIEHPTGMEGDSTIERYVNAYERGWSTAVQRYAKDIDFDDPSPLATSGWAEESAGDFAGYADGRARIEQLIRAFGKQKISRYLQQFKESDE